MDGMFKEAIMEAVEVGKLLAASKLVDGASGNMSFRRGDKIVITLSGVALDDLTEKSFVEIGFDEYNPKASVDQLVHREIYKRTKYTAILHCHGVFNVVLSFKFNVIKPLDLEGQLYFGELPVVEGRFGSEELAESIAEAVKRRGIAIVRGHGIYAAGKSLRDAYNKASYAEHSCEVLYFSLLLDQLQHRISGEEL